MQTFKVGPDAYVELSPLERVKTWKWWFLALVIAALVAAGWGFKRQAAFIQQGSQALPSISFVTPVYAQVPDATDDSNDLRSMRPYIVMLMLALIALITFASLGVLLFGKNETSVSTAADLLQTCTGFFIGVATSFLGLG